MTVQELSHWPEQLFFFLNPIPRRSQKLELTETAWEKEQIYYLSVFILLKIGSLGTCWIDQRDNIWTTVLDPFFNLVRLLASMGTCSNLLWVKNSFICFYVCYSLFLSLVIWLAYPIQFSKSDSHNTSVYWSRATPFCLPLFHAMVVTRMWWPLL